MILFDFSQIVISNSIDYFQKTGSVIEVELLRHIALNNILILKNKLSKNDEEIVLCFDGRNYWRKAVFPPYKQNRHGDHSKSSFDWDAFYKSFNQIKTEFHENLPFKCIEVFSAEADDIISVLSHIGVRDRLPVTIVSSDKDFLQLQNLSPLIRQFSPFLKKFISIENSKYDLFEHIVRGDSGDGIPNILSDDDTFIIAGKRSKSIRSKQLAEWKEIGISSGDKFCSSVAMLEKLHRNQLLIDLTKIPVELFKSIEDQYYEEKPIRGNLFHYLTTHKLKKILSSGLI
jgi:hypothetical protein